MMDSAGDAKISESWTATLSSSSCMSSLRDIQRQLLSVISHYNPDVLLLNGKGIPALGPTQRKRRQGESVGMA